jgi:hypothetical protein
VALSPQLIKQPHEDAKINSARKKACASSASFRQFSVLHPLSIMANFIAHRSTPRELFEESKSLYYVVPEDQFKPLRSSKVPDLLFLRASAFKANAPLTSPYPCVESIFDQSIAHIEQTRGIGLARTDALKRWPSGSTPAPAAPAPAGAGAGAGAGAAGAGAGADAAGAGIIVSAGSTLSPDELIFNTAVDCWYCRPASTTTPSLDILKPTFMGIVQELCMALNTHTDNAAFQALFSTLLPIICVSVAPQMLKLIDTLQNSSDHVASMTETIHDKSTNTGTKEPASSIRYRIAGGFSFRRHRALRGNDPSHMPQHLSELKEEAGTVSPLFLYSIRSTAIAYMLAHMLAEEQDKLHKPLHKFFSTIFSSSGDGFCFEYISLQNILREQQIHVSRLISDPKSVPNGAKKAPDSITLTPPSRICYFSKDSHIVFRKGTLYVPFISNYPGTDAVGWCTDQDGSGYLVFFQAATSDTHPLKFSPNTTAENSRAMQMVKNWSSKAGCDIDPDALLLLFISNNKRLKESQDGYPEIGLKKQYVWRRDHGSLPHRHTE